LAITKEGKEKEMRKLASIQKILGIRPIEGADNIECVTVLGWECVTKKEEFRVGELMVYIEVDSILPDRPEFEFLRDRKFRVRTIKLRKQISQGLCLPLTMLPENTWKEGDDVTDILGITKYDPQLIQETLERERMDSKKKSWIEKFLMSFKFYRNMVYRKKSEVWPGFISKTDEERIQNMPSVCAKEVTVHFDTTEKLDGQSATYALKRLPRKFWQFNVRHQFFVCSRNIHLKTPHQCSYWEIAKKYDIENVLKNLILDEDYVVLQGEIIGPGIQKNRYNMPDYEFFAFNLEFSDKRMSYNVMSNLLDKAVKVVPWVGKRYLGNDVNSSVEIAKGMSSLANIKREGVVMRGNHLSFKIINPDYLLKYAE
jgi:hypothetical protein